MTIQVGTEEQNGKAGQYFVISYQHLAFELYLPLYNPLTKSWLLNAYIRLCPCVSLLLCA